MFRFAHKGVVLWPVTLRQDTDAGEVQDVTVHVAYQLIPRKELRARESAALKRLSLQSVQDAQDTGQLADLLDEVTRREDDDVEFLVQHITGWSGFVGEDDQPLEFSEERLRALLDYDAFYKPVLGGLHEASRSGPAKNSSPGSGGTPAPAQA